MTKPGDKAPVVGGGKQASAVEAFLDEARKVPAPHQKAGRARLIFALDATMSRQPTWDLALPVAAGRCREAGSAFGGLDVQLVYFRGFGECRASHFVAGGAGLGRADGADRGAAAARRRSLKVLNHVRDEARQAPVGALVYVGDAMEERVDDLAAVAGELGLLGVKAFMFHEGRRCEPPAHAFRRDRQAHRRRLCAHSMLRRPPRLAALLAAAAAYAAGGRPALERQARDGGEVARALLTQMR